MKHKLFVDDTRDFPKVGFECCRDAHVAKVHMTIMEFAYISLDYSLGRGCENGLDILIWMKENNIFVPEINIHSNHLIGRELMYDYCKENFPDSVVTKHMLPN